MNVSYVIDAIRTPRGRGKAGKGALSGVHPQELFAQLLRALGERGAISSADVPADVEDVIVGCVSQANEQGANLARNAVLAAGWPVSVSGVTLNRFCGSAQQAINFAAMAVASGAMDLVVAGGVESMSRVPMGADGGGVDGNNLDLRERCFQVPQGISADLVATVEKFSRTELDGFALASQQRAVRAMEAGRFSKSLIPVRSKAGTVILATDESPRKETTIEGLSALAPAFVALGAMQVGAKGETMDQIATARYPAVGAISHVHTAGNSSGLADGAALVLVASEAYVKRHGIKPRAKIRSVATVGTEPVIMLTGPAPASEKALRLAGMRATDIDVWEINEAFAAVVLETIRRLDIDPDRVNVNGGAIALGHPLGATGAVLVGMALDELERRGKATAMVTMCIGGGQGIATILERM